MARTKILPPNPYSKQIDAPLPDPQRESAVNYAQLPENIQWMSGDRGFTKRPGSLPFCVSNAINPMFNAGNPLRNWGCGLLAVRTPTTSVSFPGVETYGDPVSIISVQWNGLVALKRLKTALIRETTLLMKAPYARSDAGYYFYDNTSQIPITAVSLVNTVGEIAASISATPFNGGLQQNSLALQAQPEQPYSGVCPTGNVNKPLSAYQPSVILNSNSEDYSDRLRASANTERIDAINLAGDVLIAGGGGGILHYDGFRSYVAGAYDLSPIDAAHWNNALVGAGALTGIYKYMWTHVIRLPSGEILEGNPSAVSPGISATAQNIQVQWRADELRPGFISSGSLITTTYRLETYTTSVSSASQQVFTLSEPNTFQVGEYATIVNGGQTGRAQVSGVSGQQITVFGGFGFLLSVGTAYISTGGTIRLYRTVAGGNIFYKLRDFAINENPWNIAPYTWMTDSTLDSALGAQYNDTAYTTEASPINVFALTEHQGRIVILTTGNRQVYNATGTSPYAYSVPSLPPSVMFTPASTKFAFPPANSFPLSSASRVPKGLVSVNDTLYIFSSNAIEMITGTLDTEVSYTRSSITTDVGCTDSRSIIDIDGTIYFRSSLGMAALRGTSISYDWSAPVNDILTNSPTLRTSCYYWRSKNLLLVSVLNPLTLKNWDGGTNYDGATDTTLGLSSTSFRSVYLAGPQPGFTLVYDLETERWAHWDVDTYNGAVEIFGDLIVSPPLANNTNQTYLTRYSDACNWTDSGTPFTARYYSEWFDGGVPSVDKSFNRAQVFSTDTVEAGGQGFKLTVSTERDWAPGLTVDKFVDITDFKVGTAYGETPYDTQPYGDPELSEKVFPLSNQRCKSLRVVIENSEPNRNIAINAVSVEVQPKYVNMKDE